MTRQIIVTIIFAGTILTSAQASSCEFSEGRCEHQPVTVRVAQNDSLSSCDDCQKPIYESPVAFLRSYPMLPARTILIRERDDIPEEILLSCGNGSIDAYYEQCDDGNRVNGDGCNSICQNEICGNSNKDFGEDCDDGNVNSNDGCSELCLVEYCGDGVQQLNEQCDDGNLVNNDSCDNLCRPPLCQDGELQGDEECDDGNATSGDGCNSLCELESCGNGNLDLYEGCDDGNRTSGDDCSSTCQVEACGNGILEPLRIPAEECDDGNTDNNDKCSSTCKNEYCGDNIVQTGETCDDGNTNNTDSCDNFCRTPVCGNGTIEGSEKCDDGNTISGDGCNSDCTVVTIAEICTDLVDNDLDGDIDVYDADCKMVFATSATVTSTMTPTPAVTGCTGSGLTNADCICNALAASSSLDYINDSLGDKTWVAFLSTTSVDAISRLTHGGYYLSANKVVVAENIADLVDADPLLTSISRNESNVAVTGSAWTGSNSSGVNSGNTCGSWTNILLNGTLGTVTQTSSSWINSGSLLACLLANAARLYCFEL